MALSLLNLLDKCEIDSEEVTYPIAPNVFIGVKMALCVILVEGVDRPNTTHKCDTDRGYYQDVRKSEVSASIADNSNRSAFVVIMPHRRRTEKLPLFN